MQLQVQTPVRELSAPSKSSCAAAVAIGITMDDAQAAPSVTVPINCSGGRITLITGPSGSGKSSLLHAATAAFEEAGVRVIVPARKLVEKPAVDLVRGRDTEHAMGLLSAAGLADFAVMTRRPSELSDGQRERLRLAVTLRTALASKTKCVVVIDEFGTRLDHVTAQAMAFTLARCVRRSGERGLHKVSLIVARPDDDVAEALVPDQHINLTLTGACASTHHEQNAHERVNPFDERVVVEAGSRDDYVALSRWHYRPGPPAAAVKTLRARDTHSGETVGVLVACMPTPNAGWRTQAWGDRYRSGDKRLDLQRLNEEMRRLARVIVDPSYRGVGVAKRLVRAYLDEPLTVRTEAIATMGRACPFFERAGMHAYDTPMPLGSARLLDAFEHCGVERWRLAMPASVRRRVVEKQGEAFLKRELRRWNSGATPPKHLRHDPGVDEVLRCACRSIACRPMAYAFEQK